MLHSSSLHYYAACYCALICLFCQQHQQHWHAANAVTIIIDGASSNEWATRDEYQRLASDGGGGGGAEASSQQKEPELVGGARGGGGSSGGVGVFEDAELARLPSANAPLGSRSRSRLGGDSSSAAAAATAAEEVADLADLLASSGATQRHLLAPAALETEEISNSFRGQQQQQQQLKPAEEFDLALDRLDLIERERQAEVARLNELNALEKAAESSVARALDHTAQATGARINVADIPADAYVAMAKANRRRKQRDVPKRRCGDDLTKALEFVCKHRFYNGDSQPEVVQPVIKSKRSVDNKMAAAVAPSGEQQHQHQHDGIRKLHGEEDGDGLVPARTSSSLSSLQPELSSLSSSSSLISSSSSLLNNDGINDNTPHNQQSEYLSNYNNNNNNKSGGSGGGGANNNHNSGNNLKAKIRSKKALMRRIRGASEECCERSCTYADMEAYCASQAQAAA